MPGKPSRLTVTKLRASAVNSPPLNDQLEDQVRRDAKLHNKVKRFTESNGFNALIIVTIFINSIFIAMETDDNLMAQHATFLISVDNICLGIYTIEFLLRIYAAPIDYWKSGYNCFDFAILATSYAQVFLDAYASKQKTQFGALKVFRTLRTLRTLRTASFIKGLQVLITALINTFRDWVINILLLQLLLMFVFAIFGYFLYGKPDENGDAADWGSFQRSMLTLWQYTTADSWTDIQQNMDDGDCSYGRVFSIIFICLGHFVFANIFVGVICLNISDTNERVDKEQLMARETVRKNKRVFMMRKQQEDIKNMRIQQRKGHYANFHEIIRDARASVSHDEPVVVTDLAANLLWLETFMQTLDYMDGTMYRIQQYNFEMATKLAYVLEKRLLRTVTSPAEDNE